MSNNLKNNFPINIWLTVWLRQNAAYRPNLNASLTPDLNLNAILNQDLKIRPNLTLRQNLRPDSDSLNLCPKRLMSLALYDPLAAIFNQKPKTASLKERAKVKTDKGSLKSKPKKEAPRPIRGRRLIG
ncbi:MAG: hypothetical protein LBI10_09185 [Deltaproteobacteria bacterium]|jgi:hypothetical protein|nr:hypothetical protein [Deltaproteobacteria bacterium]